MPSHVELATRCLREAANFFRALGEQSPPLKEQMHVNAKTYETVAHLLESDPSGSLSPHSPGE